MFVYDKVHSGYICPEGKLLVPIFRAEDGFVKYANKKACLDCCHKNECTNGRYRTIQDRPFAEYARAVDKQRKENPDTYHLRKQLSEHPFGTVKRALGFTYFLTKGTENVRAESCLHFLIYNIKRAINIVGKRELSVALLE